MQSRAELESRNSVDKTPVSTKMDHTPMVSRIKPNQFNRDVEHVYAEGGKSETNIARNRDELQLLNAAGVNKIQVVK